MQVSPPPLTELHEENTVEFSLHIQCTWWNATPQLWNATHRLLQTAPLVRFQCASNLSGIIYKAEYRLDNSQQTAPLKRL